MNFPQPSEPANQSPLSIKPHSPKYEVRGTNRNPRPSRIPQTPARAMLTQRMLCAASSNTL